VVSLQVTNIVTILQALVRLYLGNSDLPIVDNCSLVMLHKIFYRLRVLTVVVDSRTARMGSENSDRNHFFAWLCCSNLEVTVVIFATYNESLLVRFYSLKWLAIVENVLSNCFSSSIDWLELITFFHRWSIHFGPKFECESVGHCRACRKKFSALMHAGHMQLNNVGIAAFASLDVTWSDHLSLKLECTNLQ
jgi:hypothetical protein